MSVRRLAQGAVNLFYDTIQSNIGAALDAVNADTVVLNTVPHMSLENPKSYFIYPQAQGYQCPSVFIIIDDMDFNIDKHAANFINATDKINVSIVVEDQDIQTLTYKCWRYQSALHSVLDLVTMSTSDNKLVLKSVVYHSAFSDIYMNKDGPGGFRKEVLLKCEVTHLENF